MDPLASQVFTITPAGSMSNSVTPFGFGYSWNTGSGNNAGISLNTNLVTLIHGIRFHWPSLPGTNVIVFDWHDLTAGATQVTLRVNAAGAFQFYLGNGTGTPLGPASASGIATINTWIYIECKVTISPTVGVVECRINGNSTPIISATGLNTQNTANTFLNALFVPSPASASNYDDWYMLDTTAAAPLNTYLGNVQVRGNAPNANSANGARNAWMPTNPQNVNWQNVGNIPINAAQFNADSTAGDYDMFRFPLIPASAVFFVNEWVQVELDSAGARTVALNCTSGGVDSLGAAFTPPTGAPSLVNQPYVVDPNTSAAWTVAAASAAEFGLKVVT
jgi:hypothetical protein